MNIGNKIKLCRKDKGMSQEELGQQLMVSRQTISLWETGQATPTIDNLMRLKEIFGMSLDGILGNENSAKPEAEEVYSFNVTPDDHCAIQRIATKRNIEKLKHSFIIFAAMTLALICLKAPDFTVGMVFALLVMSVAVFIKQKISLARVFKRTRKNPASTFNYALYRDYMTVDISRGGEVTHTVKIYYSDIEKIYNFGKHMAILHKNILYPIITAELNTDSKIFNFKRMDHSLSPQAFSTRKRTTVSAYLTALSLAAIPVALGLVIGVADMTGYFIENTWLFYLFAPIPTALIVYGGYLKSKKMSGTLGIVTGALALSAMLGYGSLWLFL